MNIPLCSFEYHMYFTIISLLFVLFAINSGRRMDPQALLLGAISIQLYLSISIPAMSYVHPTW
jgi:uncharacterized membrane protein YagU involved in acid resistance